MLIRKERGGRKGRREEEEEPRGLENEHTYTYLWMEERERERRDFFFSCSTKILNGGKSWV